ncbi:MAG: site-specific integrase [Thiobacillaceae bacterium]
MSLYKRNDSSVWWIKLRHNGQTIQRSTGTEDRVLAQEYHDRLKTSLWEQSRLGTKPKRSWQEAVVRWLAETQHKATQHDDLMHLRWLDKPFSSLMLDEITRDKIDSVIQTRQAGGVANATVNRTLSVIRAVMRKAALDWEWIDRYPKIRLLPEAKRRVRWLTQQEAERLIGELPEHLSAMVRFSLETGLRQANVTGLQWSQVDRVRRCAWIHPDQAKARKAIAVPLSVRALTVLQEQAGKHAKYVFTYKGARITQVNTKAWHSALKRAGIENFRWHDLRHTWASWHVQAGTPLHALQELGAWESAEMVRRYAHLSSEHLSQYVERLPRLQGANDQQVATF